MNDARRHASSRRRPVRGARASTLRHAIAFGMSTGIALGAGTARGQSPESEGSGSDSAADDRVASDGSGLATGNDRLKLTVSGQVSRGLLLYDDGRDTGAIHVDNDNSSTRVRFSAESASSEAFVLGALVEVEFQSNPSNLVSQEDERDVGSNTFDERKFEVYAKSDAWGELLIGQGSTASDGTAEIDLSGTGLAGYSDVDDTAGGLRFRSEGTLTDVNVAGVFANLDGLGRDDRIRYDSPGVADVVASLSFASDRSRDVALRWNRDRDEESWRAAAALSWADLDDGDGDADGDRGAESTTSRAVASASLAVDGGWSVTAAGGRAEAPERVPRFGYVKLGYRFSRFDVGETRLSLDYHVSDDVARDGDRATSVGLQAVQHLERFGASLFAVVRAYDYAPARGAFADEDDGSGDGPDAGGDADPIRVAMVGLRVPF